MGQSLNIARSIEYRLWQILFQAGWVVSAKGVALTSNDRVTYSAPAIKFLWVFFDSSGKNAATDHITVYQDGVMVPADQYVVNFDKRQIVFAAPTTGKITADIAYFAATIREGYPEPRTLDLLTLDDLPVIAYELHGQNPRPFAIGDGRRDRHYRVTIDLLARDKTQKKILSDDLVEKLVRVGLLDVTTTWVLTSAGTVDPGFDYDSQFRIWLRVEDLGSNAIQPRIEGTLGGTGGGADKENHRVMITLVVKNVS
ncbi:MAG: hypothetical protein FWD53_12565 [Phycisphaerales bacterium]|nr:hypothetical protein [Phycisphaerales bacterium]